MAAHNFSTALKLLAWRICCNERVPVELREASERASLASAIADGTLVEEQSGVRFFSERLLVEACTLHILETEEALLLTNPKTCFERLDNIWAKEIGKTDMVSAHVLAYLHNNGKFDAFMWGREAIIADVDVFDVLHVLEGAVPLFETANAQSIFDFVLGHYQKVKGDLAQGAIYGKIEPWLSERQPLALELKRLHEENSSQDTANLYSCALSALIKSDFFAGHGFAVLAVKTLTPSIAGPALHTLGLADYAEVLRREKFEETADLCANIFRTSAHPDLETAVRALTRLVKFDEEIVVPLLDEVASSGEPLALYVLSELLWMEEKSFGDRTWFSALLQHLVSTRIAHKGTLHNVDFLLMAWVNNPARLAQTVNFIDSWIANQPREDLKNVSIHDMFPSTIRRIAAVPATLTRLLTSWLLSDDQRYPSMASKLISDLRTSGVRALSLDIALLDALDEAGVRFLLRRIVGYLSGDEILIPFVFSLARSNNAKTRTFGFLISIFQEQVGYDFPHQTIEYLQARASDENEAEDVRKLAQVIAANIQQSLDEINALPLLKEFMASSEKTRRFTKGRRQQMNEAMEVAREGSIFSKLVTNIPLKAGRRTFQRLQGKFLDPTELKSISHSIAIPRSEISDPAGSARQRLVMRQSKRGEP